MMKRVLLLLLLVLFIVVACSPQTETVMPVLTSTTPALTATAEPSLTPTSTPPTSLTVCTAQLPESLFPYTGTHIPAKANILEILYEGPFDLMNGEPSPAILTRVPTLENGDLRLEPVTVQRGQTVVGAEGQLAVFKPGLRVRPSGCREADCAVTWDGEADLQMDRMVVDYQLREDLTWSDGMPVSAGDSVFSYQLADAPEVPGLHWAEDHTDVYQALDSQTVQWAGRPGFSTADLSQFFWTPLPAHLFADEASWTDLAGSETLAVSPLSYGPFTVHAIEADLIELLPNPHNYLADEGLPLLDALIFRQIEGGRVGAQQALESGECDVLDSSFGWENDTNLLSEIESDASTEVLLQTGKAWWQLVFGIVPAAYDDFYNPALGDRPDFFGDQVVRRAFASCLNRDAMLAAALGEWGQLWPSFLPPDKSQITPDKSIHFKPAEGAASLEAAGWLDDDGDPQTPRIAINVADVPAGTELQIKLLVDTTPFQQEMAVIIQESFGNCGIGVDIQSMPTEQLYAPGPEGPLFGRGFDLALIAWEGGAELDCRLYLVQAIPNQDNQWVGSNLAGFVQPDYDRTCALAGLALGEEHEISLKRAEQAFLEDLPAIPLFSTPRIVIFSVNVCGELLTEGMRLFKTIEHVMGDKNCP